MRNNDVSSDIYSFLYTLCDSHKRLSAIDYLFHSLWNSQIISVLRFCLFYRLNYFPYLYRFQIIPPGPPSTLPPNLAPPGPPPGPPPKEAFRFNNVKYIPADGKQQVGQGKRVIALLMDGKEYIRLTTKYNIASVWLYMQHFLADLVIWWS